MFAAFSDTMLIKGLNANKKHTKNHQSYYIESSRKHERLNQISSARQSRYFSLNKQTNVTIEK